MWVGAYSLYVDIAAYGKANPLLDGIASVPLTARPAFIQSDAFPLKIYFRERRQVTQESSAIQLESNQHICIAGKLASGLDDSELLFFADNFIVAGEGTDEVHYAAELNLNTEEINSLTWSNNQVSILVDIEVQNLDNSNRITFQFAATLFRQVYADEGAPETSDPEYFTRGECDARFMPKNPTGADWRISPDNKHLQLWDYHTLAWINIMAYDGAITRNDAP